MIGSSRRARRFAVGVLVALSAACSSNAGSPASRIRGSADGTLAQSSDGAFLYAVSADDNTLVVVDPANLKVVAAVGVGQSPSRVVVGPDDTIYVSNRSARSVSVIRRGQWTEAARISVGVEPVGIDVTPDGNTLLVANQGSATVQAFDLTQNPPKSRWQTPVSDLPRGVAGLPDGRIYVSHYRSGLVDVLDASGRVQKSVSTSVGTNPRLSPGAFGVAPTFQAVALESIVVSHDGRRAYLVHRRERGGLVSSSSSAPIVAPAITTFETSGDWPHDDAREIVQTFPPTVVTPDVRVTGGFAFRVYYAGQQVSTGPWTQGPVAALEDPTGVYLYIVNQNSGDVTVLRTQVRGDGFAPTGIVANVPVGPGPSGLALSPDGKLLYVLNALDHSISVVGRTTSGKLSELNRINGVGTQGALTDDETQGRLLFYSSNDPSLSVPGAGVSCESCHLEGGTDGTTWQFIWGPRKTMGLQGKHIGNTAPYHWDGTEHAFHNLLEDTITKRLGGAGLADGAEGQLLAFVSTLTPFDNPNVVTGGLTQQQQRGLALFQADCQSCHAGADMTDNSFYDVGTTVTTNPIPAGQPDDLCRLGLVAGSLARFSGDGGGGIGQGCITDNSELPAAHPANVGVGGFNTPTMLGLFNAGPYLHDGSALTLDAAVSRMLAGQGKPALPQGQVDDLVSYLQTL